MSYFFVSLFLSCALLIFCIMGSPKTLLLTSHNYTIWKDIVWSRIMGQGLNLYVDGTIVKPTDVDAQVDWKIKDNQELIIIRSCVHRDLFFYISNFNDAKGAWEKLEGLYGKVDEEKGFQIEDDLLLLDPKNFDTIQDYVNKANELRALLKDCGNPMKDDILIHHILKRLPSKYAYFFLSYNTHRLTMGSAFTKPSFDVFTEMLMLEKSKLIDMEIIKSSKSTTLLTSNENQTNQGGKCFTNNKKK